MRADRRHALILALALPALACNPVLGPSSRDTNWNVVDTPRFSLHVRPGSFAEQNAARLGEVLEDQYDASLAALDASYSGHITAMLYDSGRDASLPSDHSGTAFPATAAFEAACSPPLDATLVSLVSHEANHIILQNAIGAPGTYMLNEGLSSAVLSERFYWQGSHYFHWWTRTHRSQLVPIARLADDGQWPKVSPEVAYSASASFLAYLLDTAGAAKLKQLYMVRSSDFERRFQEIYGRPLAAVETDWLAFCER